MITKQPASELLSHEQLQASTMASDLQRTNQDALLLEERLNDRETLVLHVRRLSPAAAKLDSTHEIDSSALRFSNLQGEVCVRLLAPRTI